MTTLAPINPSLSLVEATSSPRPVIESQPALPKSIWVDMASAISSRESTYRTFLDLSAYTLPQVLADAFRGPKKFIESLFEGSIDVASVLFSPNLIKFLSRVIARSTLSPELLPHADQLMLFSMEELRDQEKFQQGIARIKEEDVTDKLNIANIVGRLSPAQADKAKADAEKINQFCDNFKATEEARQQAYQLKKKTILLNSFVEGSLWANMGLMVRLFRKYVLGENRFTGTKKQLNDDESEKIGDAGEFTWGQKLISLVCSFISPAVLYYLLNKIERTPIANRSETLKVAANQIDTIRGVFPKLGLLFAFTSLPKWSGYLWTAQGWIERTERLVKFLTLLPSWWLGHRVTNGVIAKAVDKKLAQEFKQPEGIMIEPEYSKQSFPEPASIHHIYKATKDNPELRDKAEKAHAKTLYTGFAWHSLGAFLISLAINALTKFNAIRSKAKLN